MNVVIFLAAATITFLLPGAVQSALGQKPGDLEERQRALGSLGKKPNKPSGEDQEQARANRQLSEDFARLQIVNNHLSKAAGPGAVLDYSQIGKDAAEIKKRAARIKTHLSLPEPEDREKQKKGQEAFTSEELSRSIATLDALVKSFVWNPVFEKPGIIDAKSSARARSDLEGIIRLSEQVRKHAEVLSKSAGKSL